MLNLGLLENCQKALRNIWRDLGGGKQLLGHMGFVDGQSRLRF